MPRMTPSLPPSLLEQFSDFVAARLGLYFPPPRHGDLERGARAAAREFGAANVEDWVRWLMSTPLTHRQIDILAGNLTVGETYFFREPRVFDVLENRILPEWVAARRGGEQRLRIWSAGCCTGEEPYSLAIVLRRAIPDIERWTVTILATDLNPLFLRKAAAGQFGEWSFRDVPSWLKTQYFIRTNTGQYAIRPDIRKMVTFEQQNLVEDSFPSLVSDTNAMDVIFCRNVLMYFPPATAVRVADKLARCLVDNGWLVLGACEGIQTPPDGCEAVQFADTILFRKKPPATSSPPSTAAAFETGVLPSQRPGTGAANQMLMPRAQQPSAEEAIRRARLLANEGRLAEALAAAEEAIAADKVNPFGYYLRATILHEQNALETARRSFQQALFLDPNFVLAHFALGNLALQRGRPAEAERHFQNTLRLLRALSPTAIVPESEGLTAQRLAEIVEAAMETEAVL